MSAYHPRKAQSISKNTLNFTSHTHILNSVCHQNKIFLTHGQQSIVKKYLNHTESQKESTSNWFYCDVLCVCFSVSHALKSWVGKTHSLLIWKIPFYEIFTCTERTMSLCNSIGFLSLTGINRYLLSIFVSKRIIAMLLHVTKINSYIFGIFIYNCIHGILLQHTRTQAVFGMIRDFSHFWPSWV